MSVAMGSGRNKLRTYTLNQSEFQDGIQFNEKSQKRLRQITARVVPLHLETGRYEQLDLEHRVCFHCETEIESEELF